MSEQIIDGKECRYWFRPNPGDYRKCSLRGKNDNCDEIKDCFVKELLGKLARKEQECEELRNFHINLVGVKECDIRELLKLKQTLTEIKEIVEIEIECKTYEIENDCFNETMCKALNEHIDFIKQILQKIKECEVEND